VVKGLPKKEREALERA